MASYRYTLEALVSMIANSVGRRCLHLLDDNSVLFKKTPGSTHNHQNWPGGYWDHIIEVMNVAVWLYETSPRPLPFSLSDALLVLFLHDIEKPWKYEIGSDGELKPKEEFNTEEKSHAFRDQKLKEYCITLTPEQENALHYVHGEGNDYSSKRRVMNPLAAFCHICDIWVARIYFDYPLAKNDPWPKAERIKRSML